jgi:hypothetical protein
MKATDTKKLKKRTERSVLFTNFIMTGKEGGQYEIKFNSLITASLTTDPRLGSVPNFIGPV